jgi:hypothetical protein
VRQYQRFASQEEVARWRVFSLLDSWNVGGSIEVEPREIRLFDAPIADGMFSPSISIRQLSYTWIRPGSFWGWKDCEEITKVNSGWLFATDSRFIVYENSTKRAVSIPFDKVQSVEHDSGSFLMIIDHNAIIRERVMAQPKPPKPSYMSTEEYERTILAPLFVRAAGQALTALLIRTKSPHAGIMDALAIIGTKSDIQRWWFSDMAQQKNRIGSDFLGAFFLFLNEIADKNHFG